MADNQSRVSITHKYEEGQPTERYTGEDSEFRMIRSSVKIDVEVSEALTGLKAIQREAKKATQALRELEESPKPNLRFKEGVGIYKGFGLIIDDNIGKPVLTFKLPVVREEADVDVFAKSLAKKIYEAGERNA